MELTHMTVWCYASQSASTWVFIEYENPKTLAKTDAQSEWTFSSTMMDFQGYI